MVDSLTKDCPFSSLEAIPELQSPHCSEQMIHAVLLDLSLLAK